MAHPVAKRVSIWYNTDMIYAISDLHLSLMGNKPMSVFGDGWANYLEILQANWLSIVCPEDTVLLAGDLSWAMKLEETTADFAFLHRLPGQKILIRGNHDYWWNSYNKVLLAVPPDVHPLQNNALRLPDEHCVVCGSRGWNIPVENDTEENIRIFARELIRMQMALDEAHKLLQEGDKLIVMTHYPPFVGKFEESDMTKLFNDYRVDTVVYGHIHDKRSFHKKFVTIHGIDYILTSTDLVDHCPIPIL